MGAVGRFCFTPNCAALIRGYPCLPPSEVFKPFRIQQTTKIIFDFKYLILMEINCCLGADQKLKK